MKGTEEKRERRGKLTNRSGRRERERGGEGKAENIHNIISLLTNGKIMERVIYINNGKPFSFFSGITFKVLSLSNDLLCFEKSTYSKQRFTDL